MASPAMGHWGTCPPSTSNNFIFVHFRVNLWEPTIQICVACEISWCRCQQLTAFSISTALVHCCTLSRCPPWVPYDIMSIFAPPHNKSWRRHCKQRWWRWWWWRRELTTYCVITVSTHACISAKLYAVYSLKLSVMWCGFGRVVRTVQMT